MTRADLSLVALLTVHAFHTPAHLFFLHRVQIPKSQREDIAADYWCVHGIVLPLALRAVAQSVFGCARGLSRGNGTRLLHRGYVHAAKATLSIHALGERRRLCFSLGSVVFD